jgi:hypothetical protein
LRSDDDDDLGLFGYGLLAIAVALWLLGTVATFADPATVAWALCTLFCS